VQIHPKDKPWITADVKLAIRQRNRLFERQKRTRNPLHFEIYRKAKSETRMKIDAAKNNHRTNIMNTLSDPNISSKKYWKLKRQLLGDTICSGIPTIVNDQRQLSSNLDKANAFAKFFASNSQRPTNTLPPPLNRRENQPIFDCPTISEDEVSNILSSLNTQKANGQDQIMDKRLPLTQKTLCLYQWQIFRLVPNDSRRTPGFNTGPPLCYS
jgi:hypothetical protein